MGSPQIAARFLPDLLRAGHDAVVERCWRALPGNVFWAAVG